MKTNLNIKIHVNSVKEALEQLDHVYEATRRELKHDDETCVWDYSYTKGPEDTSGDGYEEWD